MFALKSRERVLAAFQLRRPDRCPIMHSPLPCALLKYGLRLLEVYKRYPQDFGPESLAIPKPEELPPAYRFGIHKDDWGTTWISRLDGLHGQVVDYPIKNWDDLDSYEFPTLPNEEFIEKLKDRVAQTKALGLFASTGFNPGNYFERMQWLIGFRNLMRECVHPSPRFYELADRLLDYCLRSLELILRAKPDSVSFADDWGTQKALMVKPEFWRSFFKPRYRRMFDLVHDFGAFVVFHSDGMIMEIIKDLAEIGVDALLPQFSCHDLEALASMVRGRMCIISDIDRQWLLPFGKPEDIEGYVKRVVELFGRMNDGGLVGRGEVSVDVPLENVEGMYEAFRRHGVYSWKP
ncbi:MAG: uroporphyrinogen decarboxylase family protein [Candidatus Bathyarchaeia archaeon]